MQNSPDLLTRALQHPTLREAELGRRRARDGTDRDVLAWVEATFGVCIPAVACCPGHVAPAQAFCDALRARDQVALWIASRGFGGKTFLLALLAAANAILFETDVIILGGSGQQSLRVVEQLHGLWAAGQVPPAWLASAPTFTKTTFAWGNTIQALKASQPAVRGAHPTRLLLDEIDEMELPILEAAQGQPMDRDGVQAQTVMSSTHQYPDGTVTAMRRRAAELGWPVSEWCYRETLTPHGWLTADQVTRKRGELSRTMWKTEYELQEPSAEGRAIAPAAVERMFDATLGTHISASDLEHLWRGQPGPPAARAWPDPAGAWYCTGIDWAQKRDYTVAVVVRCDTTPLQVVAGYRAQRRSWQVMTEHVGALLDEYPGPAAHDATGGGNAMGEFPALAPHDQLQGVTLVGRVRTDLFRNYIGAIERHEIVCPRIDAFYTEHLYCGEDDLFGSGHPPDTVVAMALAYHAFKTGRQYYRATILASETDPDKLHDLQADLDAAQVYSPEQIDDFVERYLDGAERDHLDPILDACVAVYLNDLDEDGQVDFKGKAKAFVRTYGFLSCVLPYTYAPWEKRSIFLNFLISKLPAPEEEDLSKGILDAIDMDSYRVEKRAVQQILLLDENAEIAPVPPSGGGHVPEPELERLSSILREFNDLFGAIAWQDTDRVKEMITETIPFRVAQDAAFKNARQNSDQDNARIEHGKALTRVMTALIKDDAELFKQFMDNDSFKRWMTETVFTLACKQAS